jgi:anti-sigma factor RsiW
MTDDQTRDEHDFLSGYLDEELSPEERADVEARLAASAELRAELADVRAARDAVRALPVRDARAGFWSAVVAHVEAADTTHALLDSDAAVGRTDAQVATVSSLDARRRRQVRTAWVAAAVAAAAAVIAVFVVPGRSEVRPNVTAVATQHAAKSSDVGDSISSLAPVGPLVGRR